MHYKFNTRLDTPFWRACQADTDVGVAGPVVEYYQENGPSNLWSGTLLSPFDSFTMGGYTALLVGMKVPYEKARAPTEAEARAWGQRRAANREAAGRALSVREALEIIRSPRWRWT